MFSELVNWLGPTRTRILAALLAGAGVIGLALQAAFYGKSWLLPAQLGLIWLFLAGLALVLSSRLTGRGRQRLWLALGPGLALLGLGLLVPDMALVFGGAGLGWMVAGQLVLRSRVRMEYQAAIRHLRRSEYTEAVAVMDKLIQAEADNPNHYRFRAELSRLVGHLDNARADYEHVIRLAPNTAGGYTGLAEVHAQSGDFQTARRYAVQALEHEPRQWLTAYNLGMIEDRLGQAAAAVEHLNMALAAGLPHSRYRLLTHLWLARNHYRQGHIETTHTQIDLLRKQARGLNDWQIVLESDQAAPLRRLLGADVRLAEQLLTDEAPLELLGDTG
ncbi:MAG: hypothetical protein JXJ20_01120 [Anaerolineae bacterium]|nr:hypothetical protein [Anaerolineae bacterium]